MLQHGVLFCGWMDVVLAIFQCRSLACACDLDHGSMKYICQICTPASPPGVCSGSRFVGEGDR
jgi:hypothetical protein